MADGGLGFLTRHSEYYLSDGSVTFRTSGTLFKVHRSFFARDSSIFADHFKEDPLAGTTDANAFKLDVTPEEFSHLLWVWYNREYTYEGQPKAKWIDILRLAKRWGFDKIKDLAVRELEALELPPAERISIYKQNGIDGEHLFSSYVELCKSPTVPTEADARLLQMETLINILQAREGAQRQAGKMGHESPTSACLEDDALRKILSKFFKKGLSPPSSGTSTGQGDQAPGLNEQTQKTRESTSTIIIGDPQIPSKRAQTIEKTTQLDAIKEGQEVQESTNDRVKKMKMAEEGKNKDKQTTQTREQEKAKKETEVKPTRQDEEKKEKAKVNQKWPRN